MSEYTTFKGEEEFKKEEAEAFDERPSIPRGLLIILVVGFLCAIAFAWAAVSEPDPAEGVNGGGFLTAVESAATELQATDILTAVEVAANRRDIDDAELEIAIVEHEVGDVAALVAGVEGDLRIAEYQIDQLTADGITTQARIGDLEGDVRAAESQVAQLEAAALVDAATIDALRADLARSRSTAVGLERQAVVATGIGGVGFVLSIVTAVVALFAVISARDKRFAAQVQQEPRELPAPVPAQISPPAPVAATPPAQPVRAPLYTAPTPVIATPVFVGGEPVRTGSEPARTAEEPVQPVAAAIALPLDHERPPTAVEAAFMRAMSARGSSMTGIAYAFYNGKNAARLAYVRAALAGDY